MNGYVGIDMGTSGCKAAVYDEAGKQVSFAYQSYNIIRPQPEWAELDPDEVISKCFKVISEAAGKTDNISIRGIGISSQGEAFTAIDKDGNKLTNAFVSSDMRAADYCDNWVEKFGEDKLYKITGHTPHPMFSLFKMLWLRGNKKELWGRVHKFLCFEDLLAFNLGIKPAMGYPMAGRTMMFDIRKETWSDEILSELGLDKSKLASTLPSASISGEIPNSVSDKLGLDKKAVVVTGGHDQVCCGLGAGAIETGQAVYSAGTVDCITPCFDEAVFSDNLKNNNLCTYHHAATDKYATVAFSLTGGNIFKWFKDQFAAPSESYEKLIDELPDKPTDLTVLPYFTPSGTPYFDTETKGSIAGLRLSTGKFEILKALLEGVSLEMRLNMDILEKSGCYVNELKAIGGGAKSKKWNQLRADVLNKPIQVVDVTEAGCRGTAMLVKSAMENIPLPEIANHWINTVDFITPVKQNSKIYFEKFSRYKELYGLMKNFCR